MPRCRLCKDKFKQKYFLQKHCMEKDECIKAEVEMKKATIWKEKRHEWKINTHSKEYRQDLQNEINKLSRMIDAHFGYTTCIDCGKPFGANKVDACHLISRKKNSTLRWHLHNLHSGLSQCNVWNERHESDYKLGIEQRYGKEYLEMIEELPIKYKEIKLSNQEVYDKLAVARKLIRDFKTFQLTNSVQAREMFNKIIGIYQ